MNILRYFSYAFIAIAILNAVRGNYAVASTLIIDALILAAASFILPEIIRQIKRLSK